jgi:hypothetical protein
MCWEGFWRIGVKVVSLKSTILMIWVALGQSELNANEMRLGGNKLDSIGLKSKIGDRRQERTTHQQSITNQMKSISTRQLSEFNYSNTAFHSSFDDNSKTVHIMPFPSACVELFQGHNHAWGLLPDGKFFSTSTYECAKEIEASIDSNESGESMGEPYSVVMLEGSAIMELVNAKWGGSEDFIDDAVREEFGADCADALLNLLNS